MEDQILLASNDRPSQTSISLNNAHLPQTSKAMNDQRGGRTHVPQTACQHLKSVTTYIQDRHSSIGWIHVGIFFVLATTITSSFFVVIPAYSGNRQYCNPGGNFSVTQAYNPWDLEYTFQITLGYGELNFTQAKMIDVIWDVVVGRGGQFLLAALCFNIFSKSLNLILEQPKASISYGGFRAIVFENPSLSSALKLARDLSSVIGWRSKASILWMVLASIYVAAFPTMVSAMSGYSSNVGPYVNNGDDIVPLNVSHVHRVIFRITGADRIDGMQLGKTYLVGSSGFGNTDRGADEDYAICLRGYEQSESSTWNDCPLVHGVAEYLNVYTLDTTYTNNTILALPNGTNYTVEYPGLSIERFNSFPSLDTAFYGSTGEADLPIVNNIAPPTYTIFNGSDAYNATYINNVLGTCINQSTYLWGFSFILLFSFCVITSVWILGMRMGFYRGVVDISNAMWKDSLTVPGQLMPESKIRRTLTQKLNGGRIEFGEISFHELPPARGSTSRPFTQHVHLIMGWTQTWTLLHWLWFSFFTISGLIWFWDILAVVRGSDLMSLIGFYLYLSVGCGLGLAALIILLVNILRFPKSYRQGPFIGNQPKPRRILIHWIWVIAFAIAGAVAFMNAIAPSLFIFNVTLTGFFWVPAAVMLLIGLLSTLRRWIFQLSKVVLRPSKKHDVVPLIEENTPYPTRSTNDTDSS